MLLFFSLHSCTRDFLYMYVHSCAYMLYVYIHVGCPHQVCGWRSQLFHWQSAKGWTGWLAHCLSCTRLQYLTLPVVRLFAVSASWNTLSPTPRTPCHARWSFHKTNLEETLVSAWWLNESEQAKPDKYTCTWSWRHIMVECIKDLQVLYWRVLFTVPLYQRRIDGTIEELFWS